MRVHEWMRVGFAMFTLGFGANHFAPLIQVYRVEHGASEALVTFTYGAYALGLIPALLFFGPVSDRRGRRPVLLGALVMGLVGSLILILAANQWVWALVVGRVLFGVGVGMGMSSGSAWVKELSTDDPAAGPRRATVVLSSGFAFGPLVAGVVTAFLPWPTVLPYVLHIALGALALVLVLGVRDTSGGLATQHKLLPEKALTSTFFWSVASWAPWVFGVATMSMVSNPRFGDLNVAYPTVLIGVNGVVTMFSGVLIQPVVQRISQRPNPRLPVAALGLLSAAVGLGVSIAGVLNGSLIVLLIAGIALGSSYGTMMVAGLTDVTRMAQPGELGGLMGVFYSLTYVGFAVPFVLALVVPWIDGMTGWGEAASYSAVLVFGIAVCLLSVVPVARVSGRGETG